MKTTTFTILLLAGLLFAVGVYAATNIVPPDRWAWNDVIGWIRFNCSNTGTCVAVDYKVNTFWRPGSPGLTVASGTLISSTYDTGVIDGAQLNSIMWQGSLGNGTVGFQIAASNNIAGPWIFLGPGHNPYGYYVADGPGRPIPLDRIEFNNKRYFRYKVVIWVNDEVGATSPVVEDVIINYSP